MKFKENKNRLCKKKYYGNLQPDKLANFAITNFIDYFNDLGGFKLIFEILLDQHDSIMPNPKPFYLHFEFLQYFLEFIDSLGYYVSLKEIFSKEINNLKEIIFTRVSNISEIDIKEIEKQTIEKIAKHLKNIYDPEDKTYIFDELNLNFHLKCFTSKSLPKRIKGITEINGIIQNKERSPPISSE